jgi:diguanylate cyclase (GGDEF)-like protein
MEDPGDCYHLLVERCPIRIFHRAIGNLVIPASFLIAVSVIVLNLRLLPTAPDTLWLIGPSVALAISGTLALAYNRSRAFFTCIACAFCLWLWGQEMAPDFKELIIIGFVPLNLLLICFFRERGIFSTHGISGLFFITLQIAVAIYLIKQEWLLPGLLTEPLADPASLILQHSPFPHVASLFLGVSILGCIILMGFDNTPATQGLTTSLVGLILGYVLGVAHAWEVFLMAISLYMGANIIRDSYNMAYRDELTNLPQRRAFNEQVHSLGNSYTLAILDVDNFKKFNDVHGHDIGDQVLKMVAARIGQIGGGGKVFRYGGEEFSVVFNRMSKEDAFDHLDLVRQSIQDYEMIIRKEPRQDKTASPASKELREKGSFKRTNKKVSVTISIGIADRTASRPTPEEVLKAADDALYDAKKRGRNKVRMSP